MDKSLKIILIVPALSHLSVEQRIMITQNLSIHQPNETMRTISLLKLVDSQRAQKQQHLNATGFRFQTKLE